ncbi:MAG TPA: lipid-binding SYLF domain-containing protein [Terriglobales bacterium]|nr:lipid-binding SYLF domain-containing protein [Terriglobales bacterium]
MKKFLVLLAILSLSLMAWADEKEDAIDRLDNATKVLSQVMSTPDKGIPNEVLDSAKCIAIVPHMIKGGFVFGAKHGRGVATCRTASGSWSAPSFFAVTGGSWGAQIGVEGVDLVMMIMNDKGMQQLLNSKFQIGADVSAAAGPVGRHASAGTDWKLNTEILTYSRAKGAFAGATLEGAGISQDEDAIRAIYAKDLTPRAILTGKVTPPASAQQFLATVRDAKTMAAKQ